MALVDVGRQKDIVLDAIAGGSTLKEACELAGVRTGNHYVWRDQDETYRAALEMARDMRTDLVIEEAERRAVKGYEEVKTRYEMNELGEEVQVERVVVKRYSDQLLQVILRASSDKFNDKRQKTVDTDSGVMETLTAARRRLAAASNGDK